eukprot:snap_masked-scaffold_1-processed-gene-13.34-mRNA-1 protein AED:1.00 eAED:1.00 QI:0/0/0/0/1/1/2/0/1246
MKPSYQANMFSRSAFFYDGNIDEVRIHNYPYISYAASIKAGVLEIRGSSDWKKRMVSTKKLVIYLKSGVSDSEVFTLLRMMRQRENSSVPDLEFVSKSFGSRMFSKFNKRTSAQSATVSSMSFMNSTVNYLPPFKALFLEGLKITPSGFLDLLSVIFDLRSLECLSLKRSEIPLKAFILICRHLSNENNLRDLCLGHTGITDEVCGHRGFTSLLSNKNCVLRGLDLSMNKITDRGIQQLCLGLESCKLLETLNLAKNDFTDEGANDIAICLEINKSLNNLVLSDNKLTDFSGINLAKSLEKNTGLKRLYLANNNFTKKTAKKFFLVLVSKSEVEPQKTNEKKSTNLFQIESFEGVNINNTSLGGDTMMDLNESKYNSIFHMNFSEPESLNHSLSLLDLQGNQQITKQWTDILQTAVRQGHRKVVEIKPNGVKWFFEAWRMAETNKGAAKIAKGLQLYMSEYKDYKFIRQGKGKSSKKSMLEILLKFAEKDAESRKEDDPVRPADGYIAAISAIFQTKAVKYEDKNSQQRTFGECLRTHRHEQIRDWFNKKNAINERFLLDTNSPVHHSENCTIKFGVDLVDNTKVAVKIQKNLERFDTETEFLSSLNKRIYDDRIKKFGEKLLLAKDFHKQGKEGYIVFNRMKFDLLSSVNNGRIAGVDVNRIRRFSFDIAQALLLINVLGYIHGDVSLKNIVFEEVEKTTKNKKNSDEQIKLCDFDSVVKISEKISKKDAKKFNSAFIPPEYAKIVFSKNPEVGSIEAKESFDVWSFGCALFLLLTGFPLFNTDKSGNEISGDNEKIELINWLDLDSRRLDNVLLHYENAREDLDVINRAKELVCLCLQGDPKSRPSFQDICKHSFFEPLRQMGMKNIIKTTRNNFQPKTHFFFSHVHSQAAGTVKDLYYLCESFGCRSWLDMEAVDLTLKGINQGVKNSKYFVQILTKDIFTNPDAVLQLLWALDFQKKVIFIVEVDPRDRFHPFDLSYFKESWAKKQVIKKLSTEITHISKLNFTQSLKKISSVLSKGEKKAIEVISSFLVTKIQPMILKKFEKQEVIPYRRRGYEATAMLAELLSRVGFVTLNDIDKETPLYMNESFTTPKEKIKIIVFKGDDFDESENSFNDLITEIENSINYKVEVLDSQNEYKEKKGWLEIFLLLITPGFFATKHGEAIKKIEKERGSFNLPIMAVHHKWFDQPYDKQLEEKGKNNKFESVFAHTEILILRKKNPREYENEAFTKECIKRLLSLVQRYS